jgi:hypothetical protein
MYKKSSSDYGTNQQKKHLKIKKKTVPQEFSRSFPTEFRPGQFPAVYMFEKSPIETHLATSSRVATRTGQAGFSAWN